MMTNIPAHAAGRTLHRWRARARASLTVGLLTAGLLAAGSLTACSLASPAEPPPSTGPDTRTIAPVVMPWLPAAPPPPDGAGPLLPIAPPAAPGLNPLTGLPVDALPARPLLVKVSNAPPIVRPQSGLSAADVVFEHYVEGGLTRFSALFLSQFPARVGSVRSARLVDDGLTSMFGARLVFSGASIGVEGVLNAADYAPRLLKAIAFPAPYAWRDDTIDVPHNLFIDASAFATLAAPGPAAVLGGWVFSDAPPPGLPARSMTVRYATTRIDWAYDPADGRYVRTTDGLPHLDANTGAPIRADNVLVLTAPHRLSGIVESMWGDQPTYGLAIDLERSGGLLVMRDGVWAEGGWVRSQGGGMMQFFAPDGRPLALRPGTTWVQVLPLAAQQNLAVEGVQIGG